MRSLLLAGLSFAVATFSLQAAAQGYWDAQHRLGEMLRDGKTNEFEYKEALRLFEASAKGGNSFAKVSLGEMYADGMGVKADRNKAAALYREAMKDGEPAGKRALAELMSGKKKPGVTMVAMASKSATEKTGKASVAKKPAVEK